MEVIQGPVWIKNGKIDENNCDVVHNGLNIPL